MTTCHNPQILHFSPFFFLNVAMLCPRNLVILAMSLFSSSLRRTMNADIVGDSTDVQKVLGRAKESYSHNITSPLTSSYIILRLDSQHADWS